MRAQTNVPAPSDCISCLPNVISPCVVFCGPYVSPPPCACLPLSLPLLLPCFSYNLPVRPVVHLLCTSNVLVRIHLLMHRSMHPCLPSCASLFINLFVLLSGCHGFYQSKAILIYLVLFIYQPPVHPSMHPYTHLSRSKRPSLHLSFDYALIFFVFHHMNGYIDPTIYIHVCIYIYILKDLSMSLFLSCPIFVDLPGLCISLSMSQFTFSHAWRSICLSTPIYRSVSLSRPSIPLFIDPLVCLCLPLPMISTHRPSTCVMLLPGLLCSTLAW